MSINTLSLRRAISISEKLESLRAELKIVLGDWSSSGTGKKRGRPALSAVAVKPRKKRKLSAEALEKIREGQRKRWAKFKKDKAGK